MAQPSVWALIAIETGQQYAGNEGYIDVPDRLYRYDSRVANHKQLSAGDVIFLRDANQVLGAAIVQSIDESLGSKIEKRCPSCKSTSVRRRKQAVPAWRCHRCSSEFAEPTQSTVEVTTYVAHYGLTFRSAPAGIPAAALKAAAVKPNDQLSIERLDFKALQSSLKGRFPEANVLLLPPLFGTSLSSLEADTDVQDELPYQSSGIDDRERVLRSIRVRRGQNKFRRNLIDAYQGRCAVSGCKLLDLLEAAHISPYLGPADNHPGNGLLLRADLHTLFDLGHMAIDPTTLRACFSASSRSAGYANLHGVEVHCEGIIGLAIAALQARWEAFSSTHTW